MKVAIVTGASKGLGLEISQILSKNNFKVYNFSRSNKIDLTNEKLVKKNIDKIVKKEKRLDLVVNNAGANIDDADNLFKLNFFGSYYLIKNSEKYLSKSKGKVINITSLNGIVPTPNAALYSASKHAIDAFGIAYSYEAKIKNISVTNIAPGAIYNPNGKKMNYRPLREKYKILKFVFPMVTSQKIAKKVLEVANSNNPPRRVLMGIDAKFSYIFYKYLPNIWFMIMDKMYSK